MPGIGYLNSNYLKFQKCEKANTILFSKTNARVESINVVSGNHAKTSYLSLVKNPNYCVSEYTSSNQVRHGMVKLQCYFQLIAASHVT